MKNEVEFDAEAQRRRKARERNEEILNDIENAPDDVIQEAAKLVGSYMRERYNLKKKDS